MERLIYHIDVNNAFLSWEAIERLKENPDTTDIRTIPSAICGNPEKRHGIILAKSPLAKKYNIVTGETVQNALRKYPNLKLFPPRYWIYEANSHKFHNLLRDYTDSIEPFSIDEAFLDMTSSYHLFGSRLSTAYAIQKRIHYELGFTVNIGISTNKLLAKMASDFTKPNKVHTLFPDEIREKFWPLPIENLLFAGRSTCNKLHLLGIHTIGELANMDVSCLQSHLGKNGITLHEYANGIDNTPVVAERPDAKGYSNSTTIDHDVTTLAEAKQILLSLCETVGYRLRRENVRASVVSIQIKDCFFKSKSKQCSLQEPTNHTQTLYQYACELFSSIWKQEIPLRLLGLHATKIQKNDFMQMNLFEMDKKKQNEQLDSALDQIRNKFGTNAIMRASFLNSDNTPMVDRISKHKKGW